MSTILLSFNKNPNIGLYCFVTDEFAIVGREVHDFSVEELKRILQVPVHRMNIAGTSLVGVFLAGDHRQVLVPGIIFDSEIKELERLGINYTVFKTDLTCLGNNMISNEHGAVISSEFPEKDIKELKKILGVPVKITDIADTTTPGASIVLQGDKALVHRDITKQQMKLLESVLKVELTPTTINLGTPYIKSGILCNKHGLVIGEISGPAEVMYAESGLGYTL